MNFIIPTPRLILHKGNNRLHYDSFPDILDCSRHCGIASAWLAKSLETQCLKRDNGGLLVHIGLIAQRQARSQAFKSALGREQGYVLTISRDRIVLGALSPAGLLNGAASLLQLFQQSGAPGSLTCGTIEDWPSIRYRAANWLVNLEISRWGYERGDGREKLMARMKRKIDMAVRFKLNLIWFDGFGWDSDRTPDYAMFVRELSDYARQRFVRLVFAGYGGGYGTAYQIGYMYQTPYHGKVFLNRRSYPSGKVYDCIGHYAHPESRKYGTCLSNAALQNRKISELKNFVRKCRPGMLYIHDIDAGTYESARLGWLQRCQNCRKQWPDDSMSGLAMAYAAWFRKVVDGINSVKSQKDNYIASRDCAIVFVGPVYTSVSDSDEIWKKEVSFFETVSSLIGPAPNVQFGIREQFMSDAPALARIAYLSLKLEQTGNGHGCFVLSFVGGDNFFNDQPVSAAASLQSWFAGAEAVYTAGQGALIEPNQVFTAQFAWNVSAPGAAPIQKNRAASLSQLGRVIRGSMSNSELFGRRGLLMRACEMLYGKSAALLMFRVFSLSARPTGAGFGHADPKDILRTPLYPVFCCCGFVSGELRYLAQDNVADGAKRLLLWKTRFELTKQAFKYLDAALKKEMPSREVREDVEWLRTCVVLGIGACRTLTTAWQFKLNRAPSDVARFGKALDEISRRIAPFKSDQLTDPAGGDLVCWEAWVDKLRALILHEYK